MLEPGGAGGLVLVRDSAAREGRSLLRALVSAAAERAGPVHVLLFEVPRQRFEAGLSPPVRQRLQFRDGFGDPLGWSGAQAELRAGDVGGLLTGGAAGGAGGGPPPTLALDSLSWLLLRLPPPRLLQGLGALLGGGRTGRPPRVLALLHEDLHPPALLGALGALASAQLGPEGPPRAPPPAPRPARWGGTAQDETPEGSLGTPPPAPEEDEDEEGEPPPAGGAPSPQPLTFRLRLSGAERAARAALPPPYQLGPPRRSPPGAPHPPEDEDPDDDLDV